MPADLEDWINAANTSVIYMSMGSIVQLPNDLMEMFEQVSYIKYIFLYTAALHRGHG